MAKAIQIDVTGLKKVEKRLSKLPQKAARKVVKAALRKGAKIVVAKAKQNAPIDEGALRKAIKVRGIKTSEAKKFKPKGQAGVAVGVSDQWFTGPQFYAAFIEFGTSKMPARPFIRSAFDSVKDTVSDVISKALVEGIEKEATKD